MSPPNLRLKIGGHGRAQSAALIWLLLRHGRRRQGAGVSGAVIPNKTLISLVGPAGPEPGRIQLNFADFIEIRDRARSLCFGEVVSGAKLVR
jgi:hypothetical protein